MLLEEHFCFLGKYASARFSVALFPVLSYFLPVDSKDKGYIKSLYDESQVFCTVLELFRMPFSNLSNLQSLFVTKHRNTEILSSTFSTFSVHMPNVDQMDDIILV